MPTPDGDPPSPEFPATPRNPVPLEATPSPLSESAAFPPAAPAPSLATDHGSPADPLVADRDALRDDRRESPFGPLFLAWAVLRQIGFLNIGIATAVVGSRNLQLFGLAASVALLLAGIARWWRFTYRVDTTDEGDQLVTLDGVFSRNRTSVPLDRVQSVSTRQNLLHRICNLVEVNVQTAGSAGAEVQLSAVRPAVADRLRRLTTATRTSGVIDAGVASPVATTPSDLDSTTADPAVGPAPPPPADAVVLHRSTADILRVAFTRNPIVLLAPIPLAAFLIIEAEEVVERVAGPVTDWLERVGGSVAGIIALVIAVLIVSAMVSVAFVVLRLHDLRLLVDGAGLRRLAGLISRTEVTASVERVQALAVRRNPLERLLGHNEVVLPLAGASTASVQIGNAVPSTLQLPGTLDDELTEVADLVFGADHHDEPGHHEQPISELAVRRWTLWLGVVPAAVAVVGLWFVIGPWAALAAAWVPLMWWATGVRQRSWAWSLGPETLRVREGVITIKTNTMPVRKAQNVSLQRGIFHRRHGLADVRVRTAGRLRVVVPLIALADAEALRDELLYRAESDPRPFM